MAADGMENPVDDPGVVAWSPPIIDRLLDGLVDPGIEQGRGIGDGLQAIAELVGLVRPAGERDCQKNNSGQSVLDRLNPP
jgi:hypothetical protein